jgi:hypothetical protein
MRSVGFEAHCVARPWSFYILQGIVRGAMNTSSTRDRAVAKLSKFGKANEKEIEQKTVQ